jgi:hypothetical protein
MTMWQRMITFPRLTITLMTKNLSDLSRKNTNRFTMITEFIRNNFEMVLLPVIMLYFFTPTYMTLFLVMTVLAIGRGHAYENRLKEYLQTLEPVTIENPTPIARRRRRRGSE